MKKLVLLVVSALVLFSSCIKEIEFDGELIKPRLVVNAFITQDSVVKVNVSHSLNVLDIASIQPITTATVKLYDGNGNFLENLQHQSNGDYISPSSITPGVGSSYRVEVAAIGYDDVSASTSVPSVVSAVVTDTATIEMGQSTFFRLRFRIQDPAGAGDNYVLRVYRIQAVINYDGWGNPIDTTYYLNQEYISSSSIYVEESGDVFDTREMLFSRDGLYDGQNVEMDAYIYADTYYPNSSMIFMVMHATEEFFLFERSMMKYGFSTGDPFAQPVQIYSNITNGIGIFAGYNATIVPVY